MSTTPIATCCAAAALALGQPVAACDGAVQDLEDCPASAACGDAGLELTVVDGLVSLQAHETRVDAVVGALATHASLAVASGHALADTLTDSFVEVPLETAVARILGERSFLLHTNAPDAEGRRGWLWILGTCATPRVAFEAATTSRASASDYESMSSTEALMSLANTLAAGDAPARRTAIHELGELPPAAALPLLRQGLGDADRRVRMIAVSELAAIGSPAAEAMLLGTLDDRDLGIRLRTLDALAEIATSTARASLAQALGDADARVRAAAAEHLADLDAAVR